MVIHHENVNWHFKYLRSKTEEELVSSIILFVVNKKDMSYRREKKTFGTWLKDACVRDCACVIPVSKHFSDTMLPHITISILILHLWPLQVLNLMCSPKEALLETAPEMSAIGFNGCIHYLERINWGMRNFSNYKA